mmetsp:Transcript_8076/g.16466  ORF Transcript_8076/g.16466 Transcript_8076/m.16466 type:complete len:267 (-) Transcript_8076:92-892(-)
MMIRIRPSIVLFGDSITQLGFSAGQSQSGWVSLLSNAYTRRADVLNRGFSGYNTRQAIDILPSIFGEDGEGGAIFGGPPLMVTVFFGANDASLPGGKKQHVPIDHYEENIRNIVKSIRIKIKPKDKSKPTAPIILITPPPIDKIAWDKYCLENFGDLSPRTNEAAKSYGDRVKLVASELDCHVVDAFSLLGGDDEGEAESYGKHLEDGLHLSASGNKSLFEGLMDVVTRELPDLAPMEDGEGKYGTSGLPLEGELWKVLCEESKDL